MDRLQSMAVFVRVAEQGSFSLAARQLGLSKSAASKHVAALEERLGVRLLNRTTRRLALTEVGAVYRDYCARVVRRPRRRTSPPVSTASSRAAGSRSTRR